MMNRETERWPSRGRGRARSNDSMSPAKKIGRLDTSNQVAEFGGPSDGNHPPESYGRGRGRGIQISKQIQSSSNCDVSARYLQPTGKHASEGSDVEMSVSTKPAQPVNSKKGTTGKQILLKANYFKLNAIPKWLLYQYRVDFTPDVDQTFVKRELLRDHKTKIGGYIFDGTVLYCPQKLNFDPLKLHSRRSDTNETFEIAIKFVGDVAPGDYAYFQVFNLIMRKCYGSLKLKQFGRDFYDPNAKIDIRNYNLQIWPGYKTTIAQHENSILMMAEITHKVIRLDTTLSLLRNIPYGNNPGGDFKSAFERAVIGQIVMTDYNKKTYRISDVDWSQTPNSCFLANGESVSYVDYYKQRYNIIIIDLKQPLLISLAKKRDIKRGMSELIMLVPELCRMTGITDDMRSNFNLMRSVADHTRVSPGNRINRLTAFNRRLMSAPECVRDLRQWEMSLDGNLVDVPARELPAQEIIQGSGKSYPVEDGTDGWIRTLRTMPMLRSAQISNWAVIVPEKLLPETSEFITAVINSGRAMDFVLSNPSFFKISKDDLTMYLSRIESVISTVNPKVIVCVMSSSKRELYNAIKTKCSVDRAVISQVITGRTVKSKNTMRSIATKVAIQINAKAGGSPWSVLSKSKINIMTIGYDVCHDTRDKSRSYGATVASLDANFSKYFSCVSRHANGEELANEFSLSVRKALQRYSQFNGALPELVMIYRDGVGDGQLQYVQEHEVEHVKRTLAQVYGSNRFRLTFIIVSKRLNTRFFLNGNNPRPGTVVDDVVTMPERYDFFLVSQTVRQGTVAPTSYNILYDDSGLTPDNIQTYTYQLCHLYYNFSGQVRVPAPCQYAHKLAFLAGQTLHRAPNPNLDTFLHFL